MILIYLLKGLVIQIVDAFDNNENRRKEGIKEGRKDSWVSFYASAIRLRRIFDFGISDIHPYRFVTALLSTKFSSISHPVD